MSQKRLLWAIDLAISGRKHLLSMWDGEFGDKYDSESTRKCMIAEYTKDISELRDIKREIKGEE